MAGSISGGFPQCAGESQLTFDDGALVRGNSMVRDSVCLPRQGRRVAEEEPLQDVWAGGEWALSAVLCGLFHLHQLAGLLPTAAQALPNLAEQ